MKNKILFVLLMLFVVLTGNVVADEGSCGRNRTKVYRPSGKYDCVEKKNTNDNKKCSKNGVIYRNDSGDEFCLVCTGRKVPYFDKKKDYWYCNVKQECFLNAYDGNWTCNCGPGRHKETYDHGRGAKCVSDN